MGRGAHGHGRRHNRRWQRCHMVRRDHGAGRRIEDARQSVRVGLDGGGGRRNARRGGRIGEVHVREPDDARHADRARRCRVQGQRLRQLTLQRHLQRACVRHVQLPDVPPEHKRDLAPVSPRRRARDRRGRRERGHRLLPGQHANGCGRQRGVRGAVQVAHRWAQPEGGVLRGRGHQVPRRLQDVRRQRGAGGRDRRRRQRERHVRDREDRDRRRH